MGLFEADLKAIKKALVARLLEDFDTDRFLPAHSRFDFSIRSRISTVDLGRSGS